MYMMYFMDLSRFMELILYIHNMNNLSNLMGLYGSASFRCYHALWMKRNIKISH